jgi:hypothetical protein
LSRPVGAFGLCITQPRALPWASLFSPFGARRYDGPRENSEARSRRVERLCNPFGARRYDGPIKNSEACSRRVERLCNPFGARRYDGPIENPKPCSRRVERLCNPFGARRYDGSIKNSEACSRRAERMFSPFGAETAKPRKPGCACWLDAPEPFEPGGSSESARTPASTTYRVDLDAMKTTYRTRDRKLICAATSTPA